MADMNDETNELIDNAAADLINASAKEQADELRNEAQGTMDAENSAIQQNTALLNANTQAQKALNDEKQKTLTYQQAIDNAIQESLKQRNEMMVYHGSGSEFKKFSDSKINSGVGGQLFGNGHYFSENKTLADSYAKEYDKPVTYFAAIPRDNGSNYVDWEKKYNISELIGKLSEATRILLGNFGKVDDTNQLVSGRKLVERLQRINLDSTVLPEMGFAGVKYPTASGRDNNYTVYSPEDIRVIKREVLSQPNNSSYYNPVTYVDESLKSAIENSNFDGARFFFDISEAIKNKLISGVNANTITSGSFVLGPSLSAADVHKVNDFIVTDDGQIFETDIKDTIIATKNPELLGLQGGQLIKNGEGNAVGILSQQDAELLTTILNRMREFEKMFLPETLSTHSDYQQLKSATSSLVGKSINNLSFGRSNGLSLLNAQVASQVNQWTPPRSQGFDVSNGNSVLNSTDSLELFQRNADRRFLEQQRLERSRSALMGSYSMSDDEVLLNEFFDKLDIFNNLPPLEKVKQAKSMMQEIAAIEEVINASPEFSGKIDFTGIKNVFMAQSLGGFGTRMATYNQPALNSSGYRDEDYAFWEDKRRRERNNYLQRETFREIPNETINRWRDDDDALVNSRRKANYDRLKGEAKVILTDVEAVEASLPVIKTLYKSMSKFAHIAGDTLHDKFATQEQIRFATNFQNKSLEYGKFGDFNPVYYTNTKGQFTDASGNVLQNQAAPIQKTDKFGLPMFDFTGSGLLGEFQQKKHIIDEVTKALLDENITEQDRAKLIEKLKEESEGYNDIVNKLSSGMKELNDSSRETVSKLNLYKQNPYLSAKYALRRTDQQQEEFREDNPFAFSTTGNMRESFLKTFFNKSVGFRQQQGLTGFLANLGYNKSGTLLSVELGILGKAVKDAGRAMIQFSKESVQAYGELQSIKTNLGIVYGSQSEADQTFNEIAQYSVKSPFGVQTVSEYAVLLKQSGIYASDLMDTLKQIGDVAGGNQQKFANIANAFSQIEANGKATTRQLRQFATAGIPIYKELTKAYKEITGDNVGIEQIRKLTEEGKISAQIIERTFENLTGVGGTFENAVNIGAKTWKARQQNLADTKQLAQAQFGQMLLNIGGDGRGDSVAEFTLGVKEGFYDVINNWASVHNIEKSVSNIEKQDDIVSRLTNTIKNLEATGGDKKLIESLREQLNKEAQVVSEEMKRATATTVVESFNRKYEGKEILDNKDYRKLWLDTRGQGLDGKRITEKDGKQIVEKLVSYRGRSRWEEAPELNPEDIIAQQSELMRKRFKLSNSVKKSKYEKDREKNQIEKFEPLAQINKTLSFFNTGYETLDKAINKGEKSLYLLKQKSDQAFKSTSLGKEQEVEKERKKWNDNLAVYEKYDKYVSDSGMLLDTFRGTIKEAVELYQSGIITPVEQLTLKPEKLASDYVYNLAKEGSKAREDELNRRSQDFLAIQTNLDNQISRILGMEDTSEEASVELLKLQSELRDENGDYKKNTIKAVDALESATAALVTWLTSHGNEDIATLISFTGTRNIKTGESLDFDTAHKSKDIFPLWQRILNSSLGVDLEHFKRGTITNGKQAVDLFEQASQRNIIKSTMRSLLDKNTLKDVVSNISYTRESLRTGNNSKDGTRTVNWNETSKQMFNAAISSKATADNARAFSDAVGEELSTIKNAFTEMLTTTESAANIYDPEYQKVIGEYYKKLEATGINAFDLSTIKASKTLDEFRENAVNALANLEAQKQTLRETTSVLADFKDSLKTLSLEISALKIERDVYSGKYTGSALSTALGGRSDLMQEFLTNIDKMKNDDNYQNVDWELIEKTLREVSPDSIKEEYGRLLKSNDDNYKANLALKNEKEDSLQSQIEKKQAEIDANKLKVNEADVEFQKSKEKKDYLALLQQENSSYFTDDNSYYRAKIDEYYKNNIKPLENDYNDAKAKQSKLEDELKTLKNQKSDITPVKEELSDSQKALYQVLLTIADNVIGIREKAGLTLGAEYARNLNTLYSHEDSQSYSEYERLIGARGDNLNPGGTNFWKSFASGRTVYGNNSMNDQRVLDFMGVKEGTTMDEFIQETFFNKAGNVDLDMANSVFKELGRDGEFLYSPTNQQQNFVQLKKLIEEEGRAQQKSVTLKKTMEDLGKTIGDTFAHSIVDGFQASLKDIGTNIRDLSHEGENLQATWAGIGEKMMDSIGPAMANAGFAMIQDGQYGAGIALVAASGVASFLSGMFADDSKKDDEKQRLQTLKDLLSDIIEQAKTDASYYQKNILHQKALSESELISNRSVHDAIIAPNGNIISTDPEDYLIATKTPEHYSNLNGGGSVVNLNIIDQSSGVQIKEVKKTQKADGSLDITAVIISKVSEAISDGTLDNAFEAKDSRLNGRAFAY